MPSTGLLPTRTIARRTTSLAAAVLLVAGGALLTGCGDGDDEPTAPTTVTETVEPDESPVAGDETDETDAPAGPTARDADLRTHEFVVPAHDAIKIAQEQTDAPFAYALEIDFSDDEGVWVWEVDLPGHEVDVEADTGAVLRHDTDDDDGDDRAIDLSSPMTWQQALDVAQQARAGALRGWALEWEDGVQQFRFDIGDGDTEDVVVDTRTGQARVDD